MKTKKFLIAASLFLLVFTSAHAADDSEELPLPSTGGEQIGEDLPPAAGGNGEQGEPVGSSTLPPSGTADEFYSPGASGADITLPVAGSQGPALIGGPPSEEVFPRETNFDRPSFQIYVGGATRAYPTILVPDNVPGVGAGLSYRVARLGQTVFLHAVAEITYFDVGNITSVTIPNGGWSGVKDRTYHFGGLVEFALGRRFSIFAGIMQRWNDISTDPHQGLPDEERLLFNIGEERRSQFGAGVQYDFHVIPHGSLGARLYVEQDYGMLSLIMAIEPVPRKKMSLNYQGI